MVSLFQFPTYQMLTNPTVRLCCPARPRQHHWLDSEPQPGPSKVEMWGQTSPHEKSLSTALDRWREGMNNMSQYNRLRQIALYLLCWGEAAQVRFCPEALCFIFKCTDDYYRTPECQNHVEPVPEGLYLRVVTKPL